jgi:hypothetical protein
MSPTKTLPNQDLLEGCIIVEFDLLITDHLIKTSQDLVVVMKEGKMELFRPQK